MSGANAKAAAREDDRGGREADYDYREAALVAFTRERKDLSRVVKQHRDDRGVVVAVLG